MKRRPCKLKCLLTSNLSGSTRHTSNWLGKPHHTCAVSDLAYLLLPDKLDIERPLVLVAAVQADLSPSIRRFPMAFQCQPLPRCETDRFYYQFYVAVFSSTKRSNNRY